MSEEPAFGRSGPTETPESAESPETPDAPEAGEALETHEIPDSFDVSVLPGGLAAAVEAVVMVVEEPVTPTQLASALEVPEPEVSEVLRDLRAHYDREQRGFTLAEIDGGWRIVARHELAPAVEKFLLDGAQARLTKAALETLAVIAYRQPVSRARVGAVRGVNVDGVVRTLLTRGLITEVGLDAEHGAVLYGTTSFFLQRLGISTLEELPALAPYLPDLDPDEDQLHELDEPHELHGLREPHDVHDVRERPEFPDPSAGGHDETEPLK